MTTAHSLQAAVQAFLETEAHSDASKACYRSDLKHFLEYAEGNGIISVNQLNPSLLKNYAFELQRRQYAISSRRRKLSVLRSFVRWLGANYYGLYVFPEDITLPPGRAAMKAMAQAPARADVKAAGGHERYDKRNSELLQEVIQRVRAHLSTIAPDGLDQAVIRSEVGNGKDVNYLAHPSFLLVLRNAFILWLFLEHCLSPAQILRLRRKHVDVRDDGVRIHCAGMDVLVTSDSSLYEIIVFYLHLHKQLARSDYLFVRHNGAPLSYAAIISLIHLHAPSVSIREHVQRECMMRSWFSAPMEQLLSAIGKIAQEATQRRTRFRYSQLGALVALLMARVDPKHFAKLKSSAIDLLHGIVYVGQQQFVLNEEQRRALQQYHEELNANPFTRNKLDMHLFMNSRGRPLYACDIQRILKLAAQRFANLGPLIEGVNIVRPRHRNIITRGRYARPTTSPDAMQSSS